MKTVGINKFGGRHLLEVLELPKPPIDSKQILVQLKAAGVNPADWKIREGLFEGRMPHEFPIILGWDGAGVVEEVGKQIKEFHPGDEVYGYMRKDKIHDGTYAEYIAVGPEHLSLKPKNCSFEEAAVIPLSALTAYQALFDSLKIQAGETLLIHAGGGGVGGFAIPMAKQAGVHVITTASATKQDYVKSLGADEIIDYQKSDFVKALKEAHPDGIDAVFDTVGGETQLRSAEILKPGGRLTSILALQKTFFTQQGLQADYLFVRPDSKQLAKIKEWVEAGILKPHVTAVFPLEKAAKGHELIESGHVEGKIALRIP